MLHGAVDYIVGENVELLDLFTVNVLPSSQAENLDKTRLFHLIGDNLECDGEIPEQVGEFTGRSGEPLLRLD